MELKGHGLFHEIIDNIRILYAGPLHSMVEHLPSDHAEDDKRSEVETAIKSTPIIQASWYTH